ncbi:hypothetical protein TTHERM_00145570 (macronuclear) [Tetrahymena thermophila SB210]|uniref:Uncharacterized protein n=1 Tax=Tetrahymena thermophila (strain SB210) TaxID=312017 RepID=I7LUB2_TETTS|nr:hypothetical protein TTHERM_00145570 [Tetrahymena thermophila SB210]EAR90952.1 hypothetical protein TTHERM_00145570 [Tetrahymena thermophila SB210]|eukprot:XP_001011197.1 hypothetical protein TTHERM_00145570 [Tetrahymena thermophila SB210]
MNNNSSQAKNEDSFEFSTNSEEQNFSSAQKPFFLSSPSTLPLQGIRKVSDAALESSELFIQTSQRSKQSSQTLEETENKNSQSDQGDNLSLQNSLYHDGQQEINEVLIKSKKSNESKTKTQKDSIVESAKKSLKNKKSQKGKTQQKIVEKDFGEDGDDNNDFDEETSSHLQISNNITKKKKIRKACRFNYIEHYISHHQLSHRIETDEIIFENESFIPTNYQPNQYFNDNPISFFTLVNIHKRVQRTEHIFNNKKKNNGATASKSSSLNSNNKGCLTTNQSSQLIKDQYQSQNIKSTSSQSILQGSFNQNNNNNTNQSIKQVSNKQNGKLNQSAKKTSNNTQQQTQSSNNSNLLSKKKDYVNIYFEDRTHFQKSSLNQFIKKIKSLPGKGASLYSEAIEDFIQHKISLQKTVSYDLLENFIEGLGNFYFLRVFKQTSTDLIIDHYTLSSSLIRLLGFETSTFCSYVTSHGVPYIHDVTGNYLQYIARCMKSWVRSSENTTIDATLICADSLRIECSENIYTRTFHNAEKEEYYLVETHVFRPKKNDSKDYLLSDERINIFQSSFEPIQQKNNQQQSQQSQQSNLINLNSESRLKQLDKTSKRAIENGLKEQNKNLLYNVLENNINDANDLLSSLLLNLAKNQTKIEFDATNQSQVNDNNDKYLQQFKKLNSKRKVSESMLIINNNNEFDDSEKKIQKKLCKYRLI